MMDTWSVVTRGCKLDVVGRARQAELSLAARVMDLTHVAFLFISHFASSSVLPLQNSAKITKDYDDDTPIPVTSFSCENKIDGFYADIETGCRIFHYCQTFTFPDDSIERKDWPFFCPETTIFRQQYLTCTPPAKSFRCEDSEQFYDVNQELPNAPIPPGSSPIRPPPGSGPPFPPPPGSRPPIPPPTGSTPPISPPSGSEPPFPPPTGSSPPESGPPILPPSGSNPPFPAPPDGRPPPPPGYEPPILPPSGSGRPIPPTPGNGQPIQPPIGSQPPLLPPTEIEAPQPPTPIFPPPLHLSPPIAEEIFPELGYHISSYLGSPYGIFLLPQSSLPPRSGPSFPFPSVGKRPPSGPSANGNRLPIQPPIGSQPPLLPPTEIKPPQPPTPTFPPPNAEDIDPKLGYPIYSYPYGGFLLSSSKLPPRSGQPFPLQPPGSRPPSQLPSKHGNGLPFQPLVGSHSPLILPPTEIQPPQPPTPIFPPPNSEEIDPKLGYPISSYTPYGGFLLPTSPLRAGSGPPFALTAPASRPSSQLLPRSGPTFPLPPPGSRPPIQLSPVNGNGLTIQPPVGSQPPLLPPTKIKPPPPPTPIFPPPTAKGIDRELGYPISSYQAPSYGSFLLPTSPLPSSSGRPFPLPPKGSRLPSPVPPTRYPPQPIQIPIGSQPHLLPPSDNNKLQDGIRPYYSSLLPNQVPFSFESPQEFDVPDKFFLSLPFEGVDDETRRPGDVKESDQVPGHKFNPSTNTNSKNNLGTVTDNSKVLTLDEYLKIISWENYEKKLKKENAGLLKSQESTNFFEFSANSTMRGLTTANGHNEPQEQSLPSNVTRILDPSQFDDLLTGDNLHYEENEQNGPR